MKQQRNTKQRQMVLEAVKEHCDHPTADQIFIRMRALDGKISRGTVYRNLNLLADNGEITHVRVPRADRFDRRLDFHYHLFCTECGEVCDAPIAYAEGEDQKMSDMTGFAISRHRKVFEGVCPKCREKARV